MRIRVDLPAPLDPMIPSEVPNGTSKDTSFTASTILTCFWPLPSRDSAVLMVGTFS